MKCWTNRWGLEEEGGRAMSRRGEGDVTEDDRK